MIRPWVITLRARGVPCCLFANKPRRLLSGVSRTAEYRRLYTTSKEPSTSTSTIVVQAQAQAGHVYMVAVPIGNMGDLSQRARHLLSSVDVIAAEDTRVTRALLSACDISLGQRRLLSHHAHNTEDSVRGLLGLLKQGHSLALVTDAGSPGISDPGAELAAACAAAVPPVTVHPVPGPCALIAALSVSGFGGPFTFSGFLASSKGTRRQQQLQGVADTVHTVVLYEAPHRLQATLEQLAALRGGQGAARPLVWCRELTKPHEDVRRGTVQDALGWAAAADGAAVRGEFCLVLGPQPVDCSDSSTGAAAAANSVAEKEWGGVQSTLRALCADGVARSEAVRLASEMCGKSRSAVYKTALAIEWAVGK